MSSDAHTTIRVNHAVRDGKQEPGHVADLAAPLSLEQLLDLYQEALLAGEREVATRLRLLVRGRLHEIETFSFGSSLVRQLLHGRRPS